MGMFKQKCNILAAKISSHLEKENYKQAHISVAISLSWYKTEVLVIH